MDAYIAPTGIDPRDLEGWVYDEANNRFTGPDSLVYEYYRDEKKGCGRNYSMFRNKETGKLKRFRHGHQKIIAMQLKTRTPAGRAVYARRKVNVEPVFGHLKGSYGLVRLLLRGLAGARIEYRMACIAHNLSKLAAHLKCSMFRALTANNHVVQRYTCQTREWMRIADIQSTEARTRAIQH